MLLGFSVFIPANSAADWTTWEDWGGGGSGGGGVCVSGGSHFKIKGCKGNACPPTLILACVLSTVACTLDWHTKSNPDCIFLILNANLVEIRLIIILNLGAFPNSSVATLRVHHRRGYRQRRGKHPFYSAPRSTEIISVAHRL